MQLPIPPDELSDFKAFQAQKQFRALLYCHFAVDVDPSTNAVKEFKVLDAVHDPGWTPPFNRLKFPLTYIKSVPAMKDPSYYAGVG